MSVLPMVAPCTVGVCWGGSGKFGFFCSSPGSCYSEFVALSITNTSLCQLAGGDESDWQHHSMGPSLALQLGEMPVAKVWLMSPAPVQGEPQPSASGFTLLMDMSQYPVGCRDRIHAACPGWIVPVLPLHWRSQVAS